VRLTVATIATDTAPSTRLGVVVDGVASPPSLAAWLDELHLDPESDRTLAVLSTLSRCSYLTRHLAR
jgi:hypothetical protein